MKEVEFTPLIPKNQVKNKSIIGLLLTAKSVDCRLSIEINLVRFYLIVLIKFMIGNMALSANLDLRKTVSNIPIIDLFLNQVIVQSISPM